MTKSIAKVKYLIIGNSAGGIGAAEAIRQVDKRGALAIVSDEPYPAYSRPLISEYLAGECSLERMLFRPADFYEKNKIHTFLGSKVERLDIDAHTIRLDNGRGIVWEKLLVATGGLPIVPQIEGIEKKGVFTFTTLEDAKAIGHYLDGATRAVVIGGGLIGISVTEALVKRDIKVSVVEAKERILNTMLDEEASAREEATLREAGVSIVTGRTVTKINSEEKTTSSVTLDDGRKVPCDLVIVAIGVRPRSEIVSDIGIKINRGIVVDCHMATSSADVYACGDVAEAYDFIHGENRLNPLWPNAYLGGRVAGFNMAGVRTEYQGGLAMSSLKYFGLDVVSVGIVIPPDDSYEVISNIYDDNYRKIILKDGLVVGMVFMGNIEKSGIVYSLIKDRVNVNSFKQALVACDFGLLSLPEERWRPHLEIPTSGVILEVVSVKQAEEIVAGE